MLVVVFVPFIGEGQGDKDDKLRVRSCRGTKSDSPLFLLAFRDDSFDTTSTAIFVFSFLLVDLSRCACFSWLLFLRTVRTTTEL